MKLLIKKPRNFKTETPVNEGLRLPLEKLIKLSEETGVEEGTVLLKAILEEKDAIIELEKIGFSKTRNKYGVGYYERGENEEIELAKSDDVLVDITIGYYKKAKSGLTVEYYFNSEVNYMGLFYSYKNKKGGWGRAVIKQEPNRCLIDGLS